MATVERVGGGLVEISAVSTIIGAPIAEALIHGLKAACGMAWAPMSCFGAIHVTKACLSASVPDRLRESMGLRNQFVDAAIGVMLRVDQYKQAKNRVDLGDARAIQVMSDTIRPGVAASAEKTQRLIRRHSKTISTQLEKSASGISYEPPSQQLSPSPAMSIYTLDRSSQLALDTVAPTERGEKVSIHRFEPDMAGLPPLWKDWLVLLLSLAKLAEVIALWKLGSYRLWYWTMTGWGHAFVSAIILQLCGLGRDHPLRPTNDIVAGTLPTPLHLGGYGKIVLGVSGNVRRSLLWRTLLALGTIFNVAGLFGTFIFLGKEPSRIIYAWVGFQVLWLVSRTVVFHYVEGAAASRQGILISKTWDEACEDDRRRVLTLLGDLSKHQASIHPRGAYAYQHDCLSFHKLVPHFDEIGWKLTMCFPVTDPKSRTWNLNIKAVAGDLLIRSAVWYTGVNLNNNELYDATIAFVSASSKDIPYAIPCVRVWACDCLPDTDRQRGNAHPTCGMVKWLYFIPTGKVDNDHGQDQWVYAHGLSGVGLLMAELLSNEELNQRLQTGRWRISIQSLEELQAALDVARAGVALVLGLMKSTFSDEIQKRELNLDGKSVKGPWVNVRSLEDEVDTRLPRNHTV